MLNCDKVNCAYGGGEETLDQLCVSDSLLAYRLKLPPAKKHALHCIVSITQIE